MFTAELLLEFVGWCLVINIALLVFSAAMLFLLRESAVKIHSKMFGVEEAALSTLYFQYLGNYKIAIIVLNLVPYVALKIIS